MYNTNTYPALFVSLKYIHLHHVSYLLTSFFVSEIGDKCAVTNLTLAQFADNYRMKQSKQTTDIIPNILENTESRENIDKKQFVIEILI